jgi:hypothetical protein
MQENLRKLHLAQAAMTQVLRNVFNSMSKGVLLSEDGSMMCCLSLPLDHIKG